MYLKVASEDDASKLSELLKDGDWMVLYYAEWCGHCNAMKPEWEKVVEKLKDSGKINIADVKSDFIDALTSKPKPKIEGFPTIKMYNKGREVAKFEDERSAEKLEKFAMSNSTSTNTRSNASTDKNKNTENQTKASIKSLEDLPSAPTPLESITITNNTNNSNEVKKLSIPALKDELMSSHRKTKEAAEGAAEGAETGANNVIVIKNENNQQIKSKSSVREAYAGVGETGGISNMGGLDELLLPPAPSVKVSKKQIINKKKSKKNVKTKNTANNNARVGPMACSDIRKAKVCKSNPKCSYDYTDFKCKDKSDVPAHALNPNIAGKKSKLANQRQSIAKNKSKSKRRGSAMSIKNNKVNATKSILQTLQTLQKSFKKIGNEASKDSNLLERASARL